MEMYVIRRGGGHLDHGDDLLRVYCDGYLVHTTYQEESVHLTHISHFTAQLQSTLSTIYKSTDSISANINSTHQRLMLLRKKRKVDHTGLFLGSIVILGLQHFAVVVFW